MFIFNLFNRWTSDNRCPSVFRANISNINIFSSTISAADSVNYLVSQVNLAENFTIYRADNIYNYAVLSCKDTSTFS